MHGRLVHRFFDVAQSGGRACRRFSAEALASLANGLPAELPEHPGIDDSVPHAPKRTPNLTRKETKLAVRNALRYFPKSQHEALAAEFFAELKELGHIYMNRLRPTQYDMKAYPIDQYPAASTQGRCIQLMIMNNLDPDVAQFPHELITYGGNGSVFSNWAQYHLVMKYLSEMTVEQTLVMYSGHPMGLFPSHKDAPRVVVTNGMVIPNYSSREEYDKMYATGVSQYGQMTAGSYCYIGPQGIVHGTTITVLNAGRKYLGLPSLKGTGTVYVTSGLGGMSGAQAKVPSIVGCVGVVAEIDKAPLMKRYEQGWVQEIYDNVADCVDRIKEARAEKNPDGASIAYWGNVVDLLEALAEDPEAHVEMCSDQTSCHNVFGGGYYPVGLPIEDAKKMMETEPSVFRRMVQASLVRHTDAINKLTARGTRFWDYGNCFMLEAKRAKAAITNPENKQEFRYPSYVEDIMGDIFSLGFGPFRWVCTSGCPDDLALTDKIAEEIQVEHNSRLGPEDARIKGQLDDNTLWVQEAGANNMVVGSQARILYANAEGRAALAKAFNAAVADGRLKGPVVLSRDHHDVSGTDSPYRETSNIRDGSMFCADMAVHNFVGDAFRGATWVSLHNGGGCGWGEVTNGGHGHVLDGSDDAARRAEEMLFWDVNNGIARRAWAGNDNANFEIERAMHRNSGLKITVASAADDELIESVLGEVDPVEDYIRKVILQEDRK